MACAHVYKNIGAAVCHACGRETHEVDWALTNEHHRAWKEYIIDHPQEQTWWSI
jgi:hypothetical protein